jgi:hypothetical protein
LDDNGWLIMNALRGDINIHDNLFGLYAKFPFAGVTDFGATMIANMILETQA